jgi:hypothetical protein
VKQEEGEEGRGGDDGKTSRKRMESTIPLQEKQYAPPPLIISNAIALQGGAEDCEKRNRKKRGGGGRFQEEAEGVE